MIKYPVFALRQYELIEEIDNIVYINTFYTRYVLDDKNIDSDSFLERRVLMLAREYEYKIYPLKYKCTTVIQVNKTYRLLKYNKFIDSTGHITTYKPKELTKVEWKPCKNIVSADGQFYAAIVQGEPYHFVTQEPYNYLGIISYKGGRHIFDTSNTKPTKEVEWRKI